jgi:hypothetical protein
MNMADNQWNDEFRGPEDASRQPDRSRDQWDDAPPPKAGMSSGMKVFLILVAVLGTCCVVCCGVVGYFIYSVVPKVSQNPAEINAARDDMAQITLPAGFEPGNMFKMDNMMFSMTAIEYRNPAIQGEITLAQFRMKVGNAKQQDEQMHQQLERQGFGNPKHLTNTKSETKTVEIKGKDCNFTFRQGTDPGTHKKMREISGAFQGKQAPVFLMIQMDESAYKEDAIVKMLEAIK